MTPPKDYKPKTIKTVLRKAAKELGNDQLLTPNAYREWAKGKAVPDLPAIHRAYEGWINALNDAGLEVYGGSSPAASLREAKQALEVAKDLWGPRPMRLRDYETLMQGRPEYVGHKTLRYYWGTWSAACEAADISTAQRRVWHITSLSANTPELKEARSRLPSTFRQFNRTRPEGAPCAMTWMRAAGGWNAFQRSQGVEPAYR